MSRLGDVGGSPRGEFGFIGALAAVTLVLGSIFVGATAMWTHGWANAAATLGDGAVVAARAAAAETVVAPNGKIGTNCLAAKTRAREAYRVFREVNSTRQMLDMSVQDAAELVTITCEDLFQVEDPKYWDCPANGGKTLDKGPYRASEEDSYKCDYSWKYTVYSCPSGWTLSGSTCSRTVSWTTYSCPSGGTLSGTTCTVTTSTATCPSGGYWNAGYSWSGSTGWCLNPSTVYTCSSGWTKDPSRPSWCMKTTTTSTTKNYSGTVSGTCSAARTAFGNPSGWSCSYNSTKKTASYSYSVTTSSTSTSYTPATSTARDNPYRATYVSSSSSYSATGTPNSRVDTANATGTQMTGNDTGLLAVEQGGAKRDYYGTLRVKVADTYNGLFGEMGTAITREGEVSFN